MRVAITTFVLIFLSLSVNAESLNRAGYKNASFSCEVTHAYKVNKNDSYTFEEDFFNMDFQDVPWSQETPSKPKSIKLADLSELNNIDGEVHLNSLDAHGEPLISVVIKVNNGGAATSSWSKVRGYQLVDAKLTIDNAAAGVHSQEVHINCNVSKKL